jgi:uncharacterized membrane protein
MPKSTSPLITIGRSFFALSIFGLGVQYLLAARLLPGLILCPPWLHNGRILAYAFAAILLAAGIALLAAWRVLATSLILGLILLITAGLYLQHLNFVLHSGDGRTGFLEALSFAAAALVLHGLSAGANGKLSLMPGRILFAFAMVVFGAQHFMYTRFVASLIPAWIPQHHLWALFTGVALIAAGFSLATTIADKYASYGLFILFFGWLILLHIPRILHALHNPDEWASGFIVLGLSGASLLLAASSTDS